MSFIKTLFATLDHLIPWRLHEKIDDIWLILEPYILDYSEHCLFCKKWIRKNYRRIYFDDKERWYFEHSELKNIQ